MTERKLPTDLTTLVHHVELSGAGWRERAADEFILAAAFIAKTPSTPSALIETIAHATGIEFTTPRISSRTDSLCSRSLLLRQPDGTITLPVEATTVFEKKAELAVEQEVAAHASYTMILTKYGLSDEGRYAWSEFKEKFLFALVRELGARTYDLLAGRGADPAGSVSYLDFVEKAQESEREALRHAIQEFLVPREKEVKQYVLECLNGLLLLQACHLPEESVEAISASSAKELELKLFVDTNFLFSILGIHDNPSNEAARALTDLLPKVSGRVRVQLLVLPDTIDEAKRVLAFYERTLSESNLSRNLLSALQSRHKDLSGITKNFLRAAEQTERPISAAQYFKPYINNFLALLAEQGVTLHNENTSSLGVDQEVVDDILEQQEFEKIRHPEKPKSYEAIRHDVVLWHLVSRRRPERVESPTDARFWIATVDYRFLSFDAYRRRQDGGNIPVCVHPSVLIQLLQFWVGRSPDYEQALLGSLIPMLPHHFDAEAEKVTIKIITALSRYEGISDLSEDSIRGILVNEALRQRLAAGEADPKKQFALIRDAIVREASKAAEERDGALKKLDEVGQVVEKLQTKLERMSDAKVEDLRGKHEQLERKNEELEAEQLRSDGFKRRVGTLEYKLAQRELLIWVVIQIVAVGLIGVGGYKLYHIFSEELSSLALVLAIAGVSLALWMGVAHAAARQFARVQTSKPFQRFKRFRTWLFGALGGALIGSVLSEVVSRLLSDAS